MVPARLGAAAALAAVAVVSLAGAAGAGVPSGFVNTTVVTGLTRPTAMALAPDGRIFVSEQDGTLRVVKNGALLPTPFMTLSVSSSGEQGLLGVAFDPLFATNGYVYAYYTATSPTVHNRVSRFAASGDVAVGGSELDLFDLPSTGTIGHQGGGLHFGKDGKLFVSVGDHGNKENSQTLANPFGKILRITKLGSIPTDNPFYGTATGQNRAIWALGLRNPFTFAVQPGTGRIFIDDVGAVTWEEVNDGLAGANYGWPIYEGPSNDPAYVSPLFAYGHGFGETTGSAIAGGAFYNPAFAQFGSDFVGWYFFSDYGSGWIRRLDPASGYTSATSFATANTAKEPVDLIVAPDGSLHYLERGTGSGATGSIHRVTKGDPPAISGFSPAYGAAGYTQVTITGTNLGATTRVRFNALQAPLGSVSATEVHATVPYGATTGPIRVETPSGWATSASRFGVTFSVTKLSPSSGPPGTTVTVSGIGFTNPSYVSFNGTPAATTYVSSTELHAVVPAGATTGKVTVKRSTSGITTASATSFTVTP